MWRLALVFCVALVGAPSFAGAKAAGATYRLTFGTKDVGTWTTMKVGREKSGTYDGTSFDSSNGPGFPSVTLTRPPNAADISGLFAQLSPIRGALTVTTYVGAKATAITTCPKATLDGFGVDGDPHVAPESIVFACTSVSTTKPR